MSYDLYFTGVRAPLSDFQSYFTDRGRYQINGAQAWYENEDTGVYFSFEYCEEESGVELEFDSFATFNLNFYRPHYFALEAEPELSAFLNFFDSTVYDPQMEGMSDAGYSPAGFLRGWNHGNRFGYSAILASENAPEQVYTRPTDELERIWRWNYERKEVNRKLGEEIFVPRIMFLLLDGVLSTACVWTDAIPVLLPETDVVYIHRAELAPKRFLRKSAEDCCIIAKAELDGLLPNFEMDYAMPARHAHAGLMTGSVRTFVQKRKPYQGEISRVDADNVLNEEIVAEFASQDRMA